MNLGTGTIALPGGVADGLTYDMTARPCRPRSPRRSCGDATITPVDRTEELELLPPPVRNLAADLVEGREFGWDQMAAIRDAFVNGGFYDASPDTPPGPLLRPHRHDARGSDPRRRVRGAVRRRGRRDGPGRRPAGARRRRLRAAGRRLAQRPGRRHRQRHLGVGRARRRRARLGPRRRDPRSLPRAGPGGAGRDDAGDRHPQPAATAAAAAERRAAAPARRGGRGRGDGADPRSRSTTAGGLAPWAVVAVGVAGVPIALLLLFALVVVGWKLLRRHRRRTRPTPTARIAGAWAEAIDRCTEAGAPRLTDVTPQRARPGVRRRPAASTTSSPTCARSPARSTGPRTPPRAPADEHADAAWQASDEVSAELRRERSLAPAVAHAPRPATTAPRPRHAAAPARPRTAR